MYRDVSEVPTVGCNVINVDKTIVNYPSSGDTYYKLVSNKYYYTKIDETITTPPTGEVCKTNEIISTLPSPYDFVVPIYHTIAIVSCLFIFYAAYRLIIYPFYRRGI